MLNYKTKQVLISKGNEKAFRELMYSTSDDLFLFAMGFIRNKELAEEIVSDVYVKIWNKRADIVKINNLKSYLFISVKNACLSNLRKMKNEKFISIDEFNDFHFLPVEGPDNDLINKEVIEQIYAAIEALPPKCKLAFSLAKVNGLRYREIAEVMNISEKTVNNHLVYAMKKISENLGINRNRSNKISKQKEASMV